MLDTAYGEIERAFARWSEQPAQAGAILGREIAAMDQRLSRPVFTNAGGDLHVTIPPSPNIVPPGPYLLFIVDDDGVPSEGHAILVGSGP